MKSILQTVIMIAIVAIPGVLTVAIMIALIVPKYRKWAISKCVVILKSVEERMNLMAQANRENGFARFLLRKEGASDYHPLFFVELGLTPWL